MAIVPMKRIRVVGPADLRDRCLELLRDSAVLDPEALVESPEPPAELVTRKAAVSRALARLQSAQAELGDQAVPAGELPTDPQAIVSAVERAQARQSELDSQRSALRKELEQITPWQGLDPAELPALAQAGVFVVAYELGDEDPASLDTGSLHWHSVLALGGKRRGLVALRLDQPPELPLEPAQLPSRSQVFLEAALDENQAAAGQAADRLAALTAGIPALEAYETELSDRIRFAEVRAGLGGDHELFALVGWCPVGELDALNEAVEALPIAVLVDEPGPEDEAPIKLRNWPLVEQFQPLLGAFNLPDYREWDPTLLIAPFMGIFFGFCLGDFGYGVVLTVLGAVALAKLKPQGEVKLAVQWIVILGVCTMLVGALIGNVFGVKIYETFGWGPDSLLFSLNDDPKKFFYASLLFGVVQLTVGMLVKLVRDVIFQRWQHVIGSIGWLGVLPIVVVLMMPMLSGSSEPAALPGWTLLIPLGIILFFASPSPSVVRRLGGGAWALYNVTGLLGDVMSYARIFGLGLSSGIIAMVVNTIALTIADSVPIAGWPLAILVLLGGHTFNFVMAVIGSVVHPARLQFLEFFGKFFEGGGRPYAPFRKQAGE
jgi:V/A-type H+-transporting ATPase subunit I